MTETQNQNIIAINSQYIKDMSLEVPNAPEIYTKLNTQPQISVELNIDARKIQDDNYEVILNIHINSDINNEKLFIVELAYGAFCTIKLPEEQIEPVLFIEIPKLLYPFARQIIASNLAESSMPPLLLAPVDFAAIYRSKKDNLVKPN
ncbi:MAG: protein-export chaperone SecB [Alphaproteobacteria bacterium]|nr:protein-export chaperone SecB [Alphaproteobacteria bacterium]